MKALGSSDVTKQLLAQGFEVTALPSAEFHAYFKSEVDKYARLISEAKIIPQ